MRTEARPRAGIPSAARVPSRRGARSSPASRRGARSSPASGRGAWSSPASGRGARRRLGRAALAALAWLFLAIPSAAFAAPPRIHAVRHPAAVRTFERFESVARLRGAHGNPFDPAQVDASGEFVAPDGERFQVAAFVLQDFRRRLVDGREELRPRGPLRWELRFAPPRPGAWRFRWRVRTPEGSDASPWRAFRATEPAPDRHGWLRTSALDPRYLRFDDGTPFFAVGENVCWYDARGTFAYDDWFAKLAAQGANTVRLWMPSWAFGLEWLRREDGAVVSNTLGDYRERLDRAWQLDRVLEAAEAHGLRVMLSLQNHGPFSREFNSEWADNPYNAANGGPLAEPDAVFRDETARELFRRRLRYVVARWGYSTHLFAWELWNEVSLVAPPDRPDVVAWHAEMAGEVRAHDPVDRPISTSVTLGNERTALWSLPEIDFTQSHIYNWPLLLDTTELLATFSARARVPGKPTLVAETGADYRGPAETLRTDPSHIGFHDALWAGLVAETFGTGMSWWWDNLVDPQDLYPHFGALARFVEGIAFDEQAFVAARPVAEAPGRDLAAWALLGREVALVWVKNRAHHFGNTGSPGDPVPVEEGVLTLHGLAEGVWQTRWMHTVEGRDLAEARVAVGDGPLEIAVPSFVGDVALRLERAGTGSGWLRLERP